MRIGKLNRKRNDKKIGQKNSVLGCTEPDSSYKDSVPTDGLTLQDKSLCLQQ